MDYVNECFPDDSDTIDSFTQYLPMLTSLHVGEEVAHCFDMSSQTRPRMHDAYLP